MLNDMDEKDKRILALLRKDAKQRVSQLAKKAGLPTTTVHNRIKRMEKGGIIRGYTVIPDYKKIGKAITAYILITFERTPDKKYSQKDLAKRLKSFDEVEEVDIVTGETDIVIKVRVGDIDELDNLIINRLRSLPGVDKTRTMIVLSSV